MAQIERQESLQDEFRRTERNYREIQKWSEAPLNLPLGVGTHVNGVLMQIAAAIEENELPILQDIYRQLLGSLDKDSYVPVEYKLLAALEILKKNRANSLKTTEQTPEIRDVQEGVITGLEGKK